MDEHIDYENIFTPQGMLGHVSKHPNLDFLMNIFNIPRVYSVSGFGTWNVGQHTVAVAFLALYWSAFHSYPQEKRDRLVTRLRAAARGTYLCSEITRCTRSRTAGRTLG